jgi:hypothetical protein
MTPRILIGALLLSATLLGRAEAQTGGPFSLTWSTVDGGGQTFGSGGVYSLAGTAGQPDAARATGGTFGLQGGFWAFGSGPLVAVPQADRVPVAFAARLQPNPFRSVTTLAFDLPVASRVMLVIHGVDGRVVRRLVEGPYDAGSHRAIWDGCDDRGRPVVSGIYFARLIAGEFKSTLRIVRFN